VSVRLRSGFEIPTDQVPLAKLWFAYCHGCCPKAVLSEEGPRCPEKGMAQHEKGADQRAVGGDESVLRGREEKEKKPLL